MRQKFRPSLHFNWNSYRNCRSNKMVKETKFYGKQEHPTALKHLHCTCVKMSLAYCQPLQVRNWKRHTGKWPSNIIRTRIQKLVTRYLMHNFKIFITLFNFKPSSSKFHKLMSIFDMFFTGRNGGRERRGKDLVHPLRVWYVWDYLFEWSLVHTCYVDHTYDNISEDVILKIAIIKCISCAVHSKHGSMQS